MVRKPHSENDENFDGGFSTSMAMFTGGCILVLLAGG